MADHLKTEEKRKTAYHEAAHAVISYREIGFAGIASIVKNEDSLGRQDEQCADSTDPNDVKGTILSLYAGGHADRKLGCYNESQCARDDEIAAELEAQWNWDPQPLKDRSAELVETYWPEIEAVASQLLERMTLDDTEIATICDIAGNVEGVSEDDLLSYRQIRLCVDLRKKAGG